MRKLSFAISLLFISLNVSAGLMDRYICEEKIINNGGFKARYALEVGVSKYKINAVRDGKGVEENFENEYSIKKEGYFFGTRRYRKGHVVDTFDGLTYSTSYVEVGYSFQTSYDCKKF